ncbi:subclass B3 metallo-beta-lactamase [Sphingomonas arenae]|uniref:subclass B3 metallo-beta-lactamase n=1 Tax=Sphingomonas arenae TaxID=2812555 RepID=UPI00196896D9|nr:subclass B3 metallo-beta-lactamase [Sphingomonas arenae]
MSANLIVLALATQQIVIPLGPPPAQVERARAPIEQAGPEWVQACGGSTEWDQPAPPVRIHGNTYLVGTCGIAAILITGRDGHILIDSGTEKGADVVARNIRQLGFKLSDVKYLLHSHEHLDHVGGMARLQQLTGAQLIASPAAAKVFATGTNGGNDPQAGMHKPFPAARVDRLIEDNGTVRLGELLLTAIATPGHTPGALSWTWGSCDGGVCRRMVYADSLSAISSDTYRFSDHPAYLAAFRSGLARLAATDCDILLTPHPAASNLPERISGTASLTNPQACRDYAAAAGKRLDVRLAAEAAPK